VAAEIPRSSAITEARFRCNGSLTMIADSRSALAAEPPLRGAHHAGLSALLWKPKSPNLALRANFPNFRTSSKFDFRSRVGASPPFLSLKVGWRPPYSTACHLRDFCWLIR
jgi:hypothetical protein